MAQIHTQETWCYSSRSCRFVRVPRGNVELDHTGQECIYLPCLADHTDHQVGIDHTEDMSEVCIGFVPVYISSEPKSTRSLRVEGVDVLTGTLFTVLYVDYIRIYHYDICTSMTHEISCMAI